MQLKRIIGVLFVFIVGITGVFAYMPDQNSEQQPAEVSDEELKKFAVAFSKIQIIDQQLQEEMMTTVEKKGIDVVRFNDYLEAQQNPSLEFETTGQELEEFKAAFKEIEGLHDEAEQEMQQEIVDEGLTVDRYQQIATLIQKDPELLQKLQQHFQQ